MESANVTAPRPADANPPRFDWRKPRRRFQALFAAMLVALVCYCIFNWLLWPVKVTGDSMLPNYHEGERHFIYKLAYRTDRPRRGDVIGVRVANGDSYIKRVIGLPGERLTFDDGVVTINGQLLEEPYVDSKVPWPIAPAALGEDEYYVMGDNRAVSVLGPVPLKIIIGKVVF